MGAEATARDELLAAVWGQAIDVAFRTGYLHFSDLENGDALR